MSAQHRPVPLASGHHGRADYHRRVPLQRPGRGRRRLLALLAGCALLLLAPAVAVAQGDQPELTLSTDQVDPGESLTVTGSGLGHLPEVFIQLVGSDEPITVGNPEVSADGSFTTTVTVPPDTPDGDYTISVVTAAGDVVSAPLQVGAGGESAAGETDQGAPSSDGGAVQPVEAPQPSDVTADAAPLGAGVRALAFVLIVAGSFAVAAWSFDGRGHG